MSKLQPNYSFQAYQEDNKASKAQFVLHLQTLFTNISNAVNATIDDASYFVSERETGFTWVDGATLYTKTIQGVIGGNTTIVAHGLSDVQAFTELRGVLSTGAPISGTANTATPIPNANTNATLNVSLSADATNVTVELDGATWMGATFYVTLQYIKVRNA